MPTQESGIITGMIGVHGKVSGFVSVNMAEQFCIKAVEGLLQGRLRQTVFASCGRCR